MLLLDQATRQNLWRQLVEGLEAYTEGIAAHRVIGRRRISRFLETLARPHVLKNDLEAAYREMAADERREAEALEWSEGLVGDIEDAPR